MYFQYYYSIGAIALAVLAWYAPSLWLTVPLAWASLSLFAVASAYFANQGWLFHKRGDGRIPWYTRWIFFPFLAGANVYNAWQRKRDPVPAIQQINDQLFLACRLFPSDIDTLSSNGISAVLDVTAEFDGLDWSATEADLAYLNIAVLDHLTPTQSQLNKALRWVHTHIQRGDKVVIHCALGRGRSVLVMAAYLLSQQPDKSVTQVLEEINAIRATARPNPRQRKWLRHLRDNKQLTCAQHLYLIANPVAGGGKWSAHEQTIVNTLAEYFLLEVSKTTPERDAGDLAKQAVEQDYDIVVAAGGDGTLTAVASVLAGTKVPMGIIPLGTANALSHVLWGIQSKFSPVELACQTLIEGKIGAVDIATCNDEHMILMCGIGYEFEMIKAADRERKDELGQLAYIEGLLKAIQAGKTLSLQIKLDDGEWESIRTSSLVVANAAPSTSVLARGGGDPNISDGRLDVTWIDHTSTTERSELANLVRLSLTEQADPDEDSSGIRHRLVSKIALQTEGDFQYVVDGETRSANKVEIAVRPQALQLLLPNA